MKILGITTSTKVGSISLFENDKEILSSRWSRSNSHGEIITPELDRMLKEVSWQAKDLDLLAVDHGPGSFTGIRVAVNTVKTLSYSLKIPIWKTNSLALLANRYPENVKNLFCILSAFKNELYYACYSRELPSTKTLLEPASISIESFESLNFSQAKIIGEGVDQLSAVFQSVNSDIISTENHFPDAQDLCLLAWKDRNSPNTLDWNSLTSLYIKASSAEEKLQKGLLKPLPKL